MEKLPNKGCDIPMNKQSYTEHCLVPYRYSRTEHRVSRDHALKLDNGIKVRVGPGLSRLRLHVSDAFALSRHLQRAEVEDDIGLVDRDPAESGLEVSEAEDVNFHCYFFTLRSE